MRFGIFDAHHLQHHAIGLDERCRARDRHNLRLVIIGGHGAEHITAAHSTQVGGDVR
ncbi:hypothetical protein [Streptomyces nitrosporeus]|uniref:hypothetical protein n=1 Tax=Streptomyces nitrosporeus TaxID=28894 RepID=UPI00142F2415|nr:hypothetical protein [Streptomyces nitrosporeus]